MPRAGTGEKAGWPLFDESAGRSSMPILQAPMAYGRRQDENVSEAGGSSVIWKLTEPAINPPLVSAYYSGTLKICSSARQCWRSNVFMMRAAPKFRKSHHYSGTEA
ncbi:hypothetical protein [Terribacillus halophilus]|uniref:hypothetical protein n=1 Tax=Terribacillus halophilus TaxID=361279 RepID=UPI003981F7E3